MEASIARPLALVVEDDGVLRSYVVDCLAPDFRVAAAADGVEGLELAIAHRPDLIIADVVMPRMDGVELIRGVRSRRELDDTPIIVLTAHDANDLKVKLLRNGAQDFVTKPFMGEELVARAHNLVVAKRARDILNAELATHESNLDDLAAEVAYRKRQAELAVEGARLAHLAAERASRAKTTILNLVSHELRGPLASMQLSIKMLEDSSRTHAAQRRRLVERMARTTARLNTLVEALLEHARIESGHLALKKEDVDLSNVAVEVLDELRPEAHRKSLALQLRRDGGPHVLRSDPRLVRLVLRNLAANAVLYTERGGVELRLERADAKRLVQVRDTGPGIASEDLGHLFTPFQQLVGPDRSHDPGVGLGLSLVKEMVDALGADISVASAPGRGSTFTVSFPA